MCMMAGYIGPQRAAPILIDMLRRQEGIDAGFYTGIVTIHEGKLHHEKLIGDVATLLDNTHAIDLPGTIGLIHSRTNSGGGREWGHPFIDNTGQLAYIANGANGQFDSVKELAELSDQLRAQGHWFASAVDGPVGKYPRMSNGQSVHISDTICQAIAAAYLRLPQQPKRLMAAAIETYQLYPSEVVGLCLHAAHPDEIVAVRYNKPMEIGRGSDGAIYLASTAIAFPQPITWLMRMPPMAGATIHRDGTITVQLFEKGRIALGPFPSAFDITEKILPLLRERPHATAALRQVTRALWPAGVLSEQEIALYELLASLRQQGKIELKNVQVPGVQGVGHVPQTWIHWIGG